MGDVGPGPTGLVLAAGAGRRLGLGPKALLPLRGASLVEHVVGTLLAGGCPEVVVVTGCGAPGVAAALFGTPAVRCVTNPAWTTGMGSSLRLGLETIGPGQAVVVTPVDRPGLRPAEVRRLVASHRAGAITAAAHRDVDGVLRRGHPVLFDARWTTAAAASAHGDAGARELLSARPDLVHLVDCSDLEDGADLDEPRDLRRLTAQG